MSDPTAPRPPSLSTEPQKGGGEKQRLLKTAVTGSMYGFAGMTIAKFLGVVLQITVSRLYGPEYFGMFVTGILLCQIMQIVSTLGLQKGSMRFMSMAHTARTYEKLSNIFHIGIFFPLVAGLFMAVLLYLLAPLIATTWFHNQKLTGVFRLFAMAIAPFTLLGIGAEMSRSFKTTKYAVWVENGLFSVLHIVFFISLHLMGFGFLSAVYSYIASSTLCAIIMLAVVWRQIQGCCGTKQCPSVLSNPSFLHHDCWGPILKYSIPLMPIGVMYLADNSIDIIMLNTLSTSGDVGEYAAAARWLFVFTVISRPLNQIFAPLMAGQQGIDNKEQTHTLYITSTRWAFFLSLAACIFILLARNPLLLLFGKDFMETGSTVLAILIVGFIPLSITNAAANLLWIGGKQYVELLLIGARVVLNLILNIYMIMKFGAIGAAMATTIAHCLVDMGRIYIISKIFNVHPFNTLYALPAAAGIIVSSGGLVIQNIMQTSYQFDLFMALCGTTLTAGTILWKGLDQYDRTLLKTTREKLGF